MTIQNRITNLKKMPLERNLLKKLAALFLNLVVDMSACTLSRVPDDLSLHRGSSVA